MGGVKWKDLYATDYYRMTGEPYHGTLKNYIQRCFRHNLQFACYFRKYQHNKSIFARIMLYHLSRKYGLEISKDAVIGKGLYLGHSYNITVGANVMLGDNVNLRKGCTLGMTNRGDMGSPQVGNNVYIGINATVVGNIRIGNNVLIAPNSYVNFDVPQNSVVIGNPGVVHSKENAVDGYVNFRV